MAKNTESEGNEREWAENLVRHIGVTAKALRGKRSAKWLSDRTAELGYRIPPTVIAKLDSGHRGAVLSVPELLVLAAALGAPPLALLLPTDPAADVEALPGKAMPVSEFVGWFTDDTDAAPDGVTRDPAARERLALAASLNTAAGRIDFARDLLLRAERQGNAADVEQYRQMYEGAVDDHARIREALLTGTAR